MSVSPSDSKGGLRLVLRIVVAVSIVIVAVVWACVDIVPEGHVGVVSRFGGIRTVGEQPGLVWHLPAPVERVQTVFLGQRTTEGGFYSDTTRGGGQLIVQPFCVWRVGDESKDIQRYLRSVQADEGVAAGHLRDLLRQAVGTATRRFTVAELIGGEEQASRHEAYNRLLMEGIRAQARESYGIVVLDAGVMGRMVPEQVVIRFNERQKSVLESEAERYRIEADVAGQRLLDEARREAADLRQKAMVAASEERAQAVQEEAAIYAAAYERSPELYRMLRRLDMLDGIMSPSVRLILRTDAAPFRVLVDGPEDAER